MRVGKPHILGPKSHMSIASLVQSFAIVCHIGITISPWDPGSSQRGEAKDVAYD